MAWLTPTRRIVRWSPLLVAFALALATLATTRIVGRPLRDFELMVSLTMIVIGALCGLHDHGRDFVHAMPVPASRRLVHRLLLIVPVTALAVAGVRSMASAWFTVTPPAPGPGALVAFGAVGVALFALLTRRIGPRAAECTVLVMVTWLVGATVAEQLELGLGVGMWWRWPGAVAMVAALVAIVAVNRGVEA
jgi:hypothetical protein